MFLDFRDVPREVLDVSSIMVGPYIRRLEFILRCWGEARKADPRFGENDPCTGPYDKPYILLPPCWRELREGAKVLEGVEGRWLEKIRQALKVLKQTVEAGLMNEEKYEDLATLGTPLLERKLTWLKTVKDELELRGRKILFITENNFLLIRTAIAGINTCTLQRLLDGNEPKGPWTARLEASESRHNVLIVDERFFSTDVGARLLSRLPVYHGLFDLKFRLFLTKEVQEFVVANQSYRTDESCYPFIYCDPKDAYVEWHSESKKPPACQLSKDDRRFVDHYTECMSILADPISFQRDRASWCIGEPFGVVTKEEICLDQIPDLSNIFIVSNDMEWSNNLLSKVGKCRPIPAPKVVTMEDAFTEFGWEGKATLYDHFINDYSEDESDEVADIDDLLAETADDGTI